MDFLTELQPLRASSLMTINRTGFIQLLKILRLLGSKFDVDSSYNRDQIMQKETERSLTNQIMQLLNGRCPYNRCGDTCSFQVVSVKHLKGGLRYNLLPPCTRRARSEPC